MTTMLKLTAAALSSALLAGIALAGPSSAAGQVEAPDRTVKVQKVTYVEHIAPTRKAPRGRVYFELNDGSAYRTPNCRQEDSRNCFWDAGRSGNGRGHSFADVKGEAIYLAKGARVVYY